MEVTLKSIAGPRTVETNTRKHSVEMYC